MGDVVRLEQEPITNFRRDLVAEDELRLRVEAIAAELTRRERVVIAWAARRLRRTDVVLNYISSKRCVERRRCSQPDCSCETVVGQTYV